MIMQPYTEQDTDRARQQERAANAPVPAPAYGAHPTPMFTPRDRNNRLALGLIAVGGLIFAGRFFGGMEEFTAGLILLTIASCFLFFAFSKRIFGLAIPGSILSGLAVGVPFADITNGVSVVWGLALGFFAIAFLGRTMFRINSMWAMIPAVILFGVGTIVLLANLPAIFGLGFVWLPLLLVGAGLYLGWGKK
jgi:hypothetical protein